MCPSTPPWLTPLPHPLLLRIFFAPNTWLVYHPEKRKWRDGRTKGDGKDAVLKCGSFASVCTSASTVEMVHPRPEITLVIISVFSHFYFFALLHFFALSFFCTFTLSYFHPRLAHLGHYFLQLLVFSFSLPELGIFWNSETMAEEILILSTRVNQMCPLMTFLILWFQIQSTV